jgi:pimeloyl-ACP methyl ester carboxylesterase
MSRLDLPPAIIGGMSMGGPIVFEMYQRAPERFRAMMLIDTIAAAAKPPEAGLWRGVAELVRQEGVGALPPVLLKDMLSGDTRVHQPAMEDYLTQIIKAASADAAIGGAQALATRPDYTSLLSRIQVPTLVYVGVEDTIYPVAISKMMNQAIPNSTLEMIPGAAHAAIFEAPERSAEAILRWAARMM